MNKVPQRTRIAAYGVVVSESKILLCRISSELPKWQGQWTLPGGGIEFGEAPQDAMVREVKEETGIIVTPKSIAAIDSFHDRKSVPEFHGIRVIYHTKVIGGVLENEENGTTDLACWFTQKEIANETLVDIALQGVEIAFGP